MKRLLTTPDTVFVEYIRRLLEARGIGAFVRNATNSGLAAGELPPVVAQPELWVGDEDLAVAERLLRDTEASFKSRSGPAWTCPRCDAHLEPQFDVCWRCGAERPE